jgi:hypothetical protein
MLKPRFKQHLAGGLAGALLCIGVSSANAAVTTALYLAMDGSGSINSGQFTQQVNGYVAALNNVFGVFGGQLYGNVAIGASVFGLNFSEYFPVTTINNPTDLGALTTAIAGLDPGRDGINTSATAIGDAVTAAAGSLIAFETALGADINLLIDVTTDGANNIGALPNPASVAALGSGLDAVNCLGIGGGADCSWVTSPTVVGTDFGSVGFGELAGALEDKLVTEIPEIPVPGVAALVGIGLLGLRLTRRAAAASAG